MKIALFKNIECNFETIQEINALPKEYMQISEIVEIEFTKLPLDKLVKEETNLINKQINIEMAKSEVTISNLKERKAKLLTLEHTSK